MDSLLHRNKYYIYNYHCYKLLAISIKSIYMDGDGDENVLNDMWF